jgi:hypothetical protein
MDGALAAALRWKWWAAVVPLGQIAPHVLKCRQVISARALSMGTKRFGKPPAKIRKKISQIDDRAKLKSIALRLLDVDNWAELLAEGK